MIHNQFNLLHCRPLFYSGADGDSSVKNKERNLCDLRDLLFKSFNASGANECADLPQ